MLLNRGDSSESLKRLVSFLPSIHRASSTQGAAYTVPETDAATSSSFPVSMTASNEQEGSHLQSHAMATVLQQATQVQPLPTAAQVITTIASLPRLGSRPPMEQVRVLVFVLLFVIISPSV